MFTYHGRVKRVIDGDTFEIEVDLGFDVQTTQVFRLLNLDTYESRLIKDTTLEQKEKGLLIKSVAKEYLEGKDVIIETFMKKGFYKRYLCVVYINDMDYANIPKFLGFDKHFKLLNEELDKKQYFLDNYGQELIDILKKNKIL